VIEHFDGGWDSYAREQLVRTMKDSALSVLSREGEAKTNQSEQLTDARGDEDLIRLHEFRWCRTLQVNRQAAFNR